MVVDKDRKVTQEIMDSFYRAVSNAEYRIAARQPDLIVGPLRGAEPILESMGLIARFNGRELPEILYVETGCLGGPNPKPLGEEEKLELVKRRLEPHVEKKRTAFKLVPG